MPLLRTPTTQELEDHFFGSGAFSYGWIGYSTRTPERFPVILYDVEEGSKSAKLVGQSEFIAGIKAYAESLPDRSFDDLIEDMDAGDVDNVLQLILFGEIRYA